MRGTEVKVLALISILTTLSFTATNEHAALAPYPGTGMFLMLSDIHFDPYADAAIMRELGATPQPGCQISASGAFAKFGSDTNYPLLKSALDHAAATAAANHFHYDYVIVTGDLLAHHFDERYRLCVEGGDEAFRKFASNAIGLVDGMIAKALPGVPVFAALGNNDSDRGDYSQPSAFFLQSIGRDWSRLWGQIPAEAREKALVSLGRAGNYALPHPTVPDCELVVLNSNLWAASNTQACSETDPDPGGQFRWLGEVLGSVRRAGGRATLIMHVPPGIDALKSSIGLPRSFWTYSCTEKFIAELKDSPVSEIYAGHTHRDDFRLFPDREGRPLATIHIVPALSPIYLNNPAVEIGWYDRRSGELRDYAPLVLDLANSKPTWSTEYIFSRAYGSARPNLVAIQGLIRAIHEGNPNSGVGKQYATYFGAGVGIFLTPDNWSDYSCAQTEITPSRFALCRRATSPNP